MSLIRDKTPLPIVRFTDAASASAVAASADAVVVGSALIAEMEQKPILPTIGRDPIHGAAVKLLQSIRAGVDSSPS